MSDLQVAPIQSMRTIEDIHGKAEVYLRSTLAPSTVRAYTGDWADYLSWCQAHERCPLPADAETVVLYLSNRADTLTVSSLERRITTISRAHELMGVDSPTHLRTVKTLMRGIRRAKGIAKRKVAPVTVDVLKAMLEVIPQKTLKGKRDRALILVGFAGAFRRAEVTSLQVQDIAFVKEGMLVTLHRAKTDQEGQGLTKGIPFAKNPDHCPVRALKAWLKTSEIESGHIFRAVNKHSEIRDGIGIDGRSVAKLIQHYAALAGLEGNFSGLSLRAGFATAGVLSGMPEQRILLRTPIPRITDQAQRSILKPDRSLDIAVCPSLPAAPAQFHGGD